MVSELSALGDGVGGAGDASSMVGVAASVSSRDGCSSSTVAGTASTL